MKAYKEDETGFVRQVCDDMKTVRGQCKEFEQPILYNVYSVYSPVHTLLTLSPHTPTQSQPICSFIHFLPSSPIGTSYLEELSGVSQLTQQVDGLDMEDMYLDSDEEGED